MNSEYSNLFGTKRSKSTNEKQQTVFFVIPIGRYVNRFTNKKVSTKGQLKIQVLNQKLVVKYLKEETSQWQQIDTLLIYNIDKIQQIQKPEEKLTLIKIQLNVIPEKQKTQKCITYRILNIELGRQSSIFINKKIKEMRNLPNYISIQEKQAIILKSIILKQSEYFEIFKKAQQRRLFNLSDLREVLNFQRILLADHPQMIKFNLLKHTLKYEQQKTILMEKLKMNEMEIQNNQKQRKNQRNNNFKQNMTNIDQMIIEQNVQKNQKENKQWLQGYSSKKQFQGYNVTGGDEQLHSKDAQSMAPDSSEIKKQNLILRNINLNSEQVSQDMLNENYADFSFGNSFLQRSLSKHHSSSQIEKMQIEGEDRSQKSEKNKFKRLCQKIKIPDSKQVHLQQKKNENKYEKKNQTIKFIDPSYSQEKQLKLTKKTIIWCRLFYHYLKFGGIQNRQKELTTIESELIQLKNSDPDASMNQMALKMVDKVSFNYLRLKRGQDTY